MAIDTTLIKGAAQANKARKPVAAMAMAGIGKSVGETLAKAGQAKAKEAEDEAKEEENKRESAEQEWVDIRAQAMAEVGLGPEFHSMLTERTKLSREDWIDGDAEVRAGVEAETQQIAGEIRGAEDLKAQVLTPDLGGLSPAYSETPEGKAFTAALSQSPVVNEKGLMGYNIPVEGGDDPRFITIAQASEEFKTHLLDTNFQSEILAIANKAADQGGNVKVGETQRYNRTKAENAIRSLVKGTKNKSSLIYDSHLDGSFIENVVQALEQTSYEQLGIGAIDNVNANDGIDSKEARLIVDVLLEKEHSGLLEDLLVNHYVGFAEQNYNEGLNTRARQDPSHSVTNHEIVTTIDPITGEIIGQEKVVKKKGTGGIPTFGYNLASDTMDDVRYDDDYNRPSDNFTQTGSDYDNATERLQGFYPRTPPPEGNQ
jgi:hypothetical protein